MSAAITETRSAIASPRVNESVRARPRVLHLITSFEIGGTERQAVELLKRLDPERYDVRLAVIRNEGPFYREIEARFPDVPEFPLTSFYNANAIKQLARLRRLMMRERIDILHAHDFYSGLIGGAAARLAGVRVIASQRHLKLSDRRVHETGMRIIHRLAHRILVNSEAIRRRILDHDDAPPHKIVIVRNGVQQAPVSRAQARAHLLSELGTNANVKLIGMAARLQPVKGHRFFLEAAATVLGDEPNAHFVLVGDGPLRSEIEEQASRLGITDRMHLLGDRIDVAQLISAFDLLVLSSLHEGLPNAVMEAMAAGVPVVATAVGGTKELISDGETGYLASPGDSSALADRILVALRDPNAVNVVEAARARITSTFGMERMVESVEHLYDELMKQ
jgi:glycosyltransferase involved in cell wall biosynthesis